MRYNVATGVQHAKLNVKKYVIGTTAVVMMAGWAAIPVMASPTVSDNASPKACFGQWRAENASGPYNAGGEGAALSARQGTNATHNVSDKAECAAQQ